MTIQLLKTIFANLNNSHAWSLQVLRISKSKKSGTIYKGRDIVLKPSGKLQDFIEEIVTRHTQDMKGVLHSYSDLIEYDGSAIGTTIYKISGDNPLIKDEFNALLQALAKHDVETDPFELSPQAYVLTGRVTIDGNETPLSLISMQKPVTVLKNKFTLDKGTFKEISGPVLSLRPTIDVVLIENDVYMLTLAAENLFNMERSYKSLCANKIAEIKDCDILTDAAAFENIASSGHNPRKFVSFNASRLESLKKKANRKKMADKFSIPFDGKKFDTTQEGASEKIVKLLCNKGMIDPFEDTPVEVAGAKRWI